MHDLRQEGALCGGLPIWDGLIPETKRPCKTCKQVPKHYKTDTKHGRTYRFYRCGCKTPLIEGVQ